MPDFLQTGSILTLPLLSGDPERLDADLTTWSRERPLALLLPCHARDLDSPALTHIIATIAAIPWVSFVLIGLDGADAAQHEAAIEKFHAIGHDSILMHHDMSQVAAGKGRNIRDTASVLMEWEKIFAIAIHDCDIRTYSRDFLARLCWPVLHPDAGILACKGYYARTAGQLHGRVFRLMFQPLLRAWCEIFPDQKWPAFLRSFRYPLSGELCITKELLKRQDFDPGWGFEVKMLHSLFRSAPHSLCQAELCAAYDHKHQDPADLALMAEEVARAFCDTMRLEGTPAAAPQWRALMDACRQTTARALHESTLLAQMHGLPYDAAAEESLAALFTSALHRSQLTD